MLWAHIDRSMYPAFSLTELQQKFKCIVANLEEVGIPGVLFWLPRSGTHGFSAPDLNYPRVRQFQAFRCCTHGGVIGTFHLDSYQRVREATPRDPRWRV